MLSKKETMNLAKGFAIEGFLCSESVLVALSKLLNVKSAVIPKIATGFGAGIGLHGEVCGALSGAVMGLGLRFGRTHPSETPKDTTPYEYGQRIVNLFVARFEHIRCRDLLGLDISREKDRQAYNDQKLWETKCSNIIHVTTGLAYDLLQV